MYDNARQQQRYNFTKSFIDGLPANPRNARSRESEYADQQVIGLRVLVSKNARKFFHLRYRFRKKKRIISIGEHPAVSVQEARQRANEYKNLLSQGLDPITERDKQDTNITFREFVEKEYIPHIKANKKTWQDDVSKLKTHMIPAFGDFPMSAITAKALKKYQSKISTRNSPSTSNRHMTVIIYIFNLALEWQVIDKNPCTGIIKKYKEATKGRSLSDAELKIFLTTLDQATQSVSVHVIRFLLYTGLRLSEATHLLWENVNLTTNSVTLPNTKSGNSRTVVLNQLAKNTIEKMTAFKTNEFVFPGKGPQGHLITPRRVFLDITKKADLNKLRLHDLRHTFASICVNSGQSLYEVQKLLGHENINMTQRYAHLGDKGLRAATESVANQIGKITG